MTAWGTSTVGAEFSVQLGKRVDAAVARGVPKVCINNRGVRWGYVDPSVAAVELLNDADIRELRLIEGDLLVCEGGEIGRSSVWRGEVPEAYYLNTLHRLRSKQGYEPELAAAFLEYFVATGALQAIVGKSSLAHLTKENLLRVPLPVPPPAEQKAIVTTLRSADDLKVSLERLIAKKRDVKQGMMQVLLTGRTRLPGFTGVWNAGTLQTLAAVVGGGTPATRTSSYWGGGIPWFTPAEIDSAGSGLISQSERTITPDGLANSSATLLPAGSVLVTSRASLGNCAVADVPVSTNQGFASLVPRDFRSTWFLYYWIQQNKTELESRAAGSTFLEISSGKVSEIPILAPGLDEQEAIGEVLEDADTEIQALQRRLESARAVKVGMMQELLTGRTRLPVTEEA
jgi:type I restriction enzyme S subunit